MPPIYHRRLPDPAPLAKTPADLVSYGPQLPITLSLPAGDSPQGPSVGVVGGNALIDTRAGYTCVNVRAMQALGFPQAAHGTKYRVHVHFTDAPFPDRDLDV